MRLIAKAASLISTVVALTIISVYVVVFHVLRLQHATCIGGTFGTLGSGVSFSSKPFIEYQITRDVAYVFSMDQLLFEIETRYQHIEVYSHRYFGHVLVIDGSLQITERDEVNYHEMTVHVPMAYVPDAEKILVIGGGDGGALLRFLQHPNVKQAHLVDIDMFAMRDMVASYFPFLYSAYTDERTKTFAYDGRLWVDEQLEVEENHGTYEVVVLDSTDYGAAESLFTEKFYLQLKKLMAKKSIFVANVDSPSWNLDTVTSVQAQLSELWKYCFMFQSHQPTFLSGHYSYIFCSDEVHPMKTPIDWDKWAAKNINTYYYNADVHYGSFALPERVRKEMTMGLQYNQLPEKPFTKQEFQQVPPVDYSNIIDARLDDEEDEDESQAREQD